MGKVLRIFVYIILVLSAVSLFFAWKLFEKRELLGARNRVFEDSFIKIARTVEAADPADAAAPSVQKDISEVSDRELVNPERDAVLEAYPMKLEQQNLPTLDFGSTDKRLQLRSYYVLDADDKPVPDPVDNKPSTKGPGSMQELMDQLFERSKIQQATLNKTRSELTKMRELATVSVEEINRLKTDSRATKVALKGEKEKVVTLTSEKETLEGRVAKLNAEKRELTAELTDAKNEVEKLNEDKVTLTEDLAKLRQAFDELKAHYTTGGNKKMSAAGDSVALTALSAGDKGSVIEANDELKFVIINFSDDAMVEMLGEERQNALPQFEMNIRRPGRQSASGEFVTRVKLRQAVRGKNLVVADILNDWQQVPVEKGDVVFF